MGVTIASVTSVAAVLTLLWLAAVTIIVVAYRELWRRVWREPVLRFPVLIVESDDWGAGPASQAAALRELADILAGHRDGSGRMPVLCLALVLAVPDGQAMRESGPYRRLELDHSRFADILVALRDGAARGVFSLQLHGLEHYWPPTLMASRDERVHAWLIHSDAAATETLPAHLQSRWVDASRLPSTAHDPAAILAAVADEVRAFERIVGVAPKVVVPPTFVWTRGVEAAWAAQGIECIVTPGWRYTQRDTLGQAAGDEGPIVNGDRFADGVYLARCDYFEPLRGRDAVHALAALQRATRQGRPCLLENHRDNFIGDRAACLRSLQEVDKLFRDAVASHVDLRFLSSQELGRALRERDPRWLFTGVRHKLPYLWERVRHSGRAWRLMRLTGMSVLGNLAVAWTAKVKETG